MVLPIVLGFLLTGITFAAQYVANNDGFKTPEANYQATAKGTLVAVVVIMVFIGFLVH